MCAKCLQYSKIIAWIGIFLYALILALVYLFYNFHLEASWVDTALDILYPFAFLARIMMFGGIIVKAALEYKKGQKPSRRDLIIVVLALVTVLVYYVVRYILTR